MSIIVGYNITEYNIKKKSFTILKEELKKTKKISKIKTKESSSNITELKEIENNNLIDSPLPFKREEQLLRNEEKNINSSIEKLFSNIIWKKDKNKKLFNSIIIFDWDDTLLCTSLINKYGYFSEMKKYPMNDLIQISLLEAFVMEILEKSFEKGDTYIITNSEKGWVEYSCKKFFPNLFPLLSKLKIISSREKYEKMHPYNFLMWKMEVCKYFAKDYNYNINLPTNIISIGDSFADIEAGRSLENKFKKCFIKTVKFVKFPGVKDLIEQLGLILDKFEHIISSCYNWNIKVEKKIIGKKVICDLN